MTKEEIDIKIEELKASMTGDFSHDLTIASQVHALRIERDGVEIANAADDADDCAMCSG